ncbi:MAG: cytochrome b [Brevundimonas sp.]|uniref:cytochrome b n=1 Tax=Brevundimonas sp. TaxID=1871086 RepID=UPI00391C67C5
MSARYSTVAIVLHWLIALLAFAQIGLIMVADGLEGPERGLYIMLHKSGGMTILLLTLVRIGWRLGHRPPPLPESTPRWQKISARTVQTMFYVVLLALPLSGWIAASAADRPTIWYSLFTIPNLPAPQSMDLARQMIGIHSLWAKVFYVLVALHLAGALKHHFLNRDGVLARMLPLVGPGR